MRLYHLLFIIVLCACSLPHEVIIDGSRKPLDNTAEVAVLDIKQPMPDSSKLLATLRYTEDISNPSHSYKQLIQTAQQEARKVGGNLIKVTDLQVTGAYVLCVSVFHRDNINDIDSRLLAIQDSLHRQKFGAGKPTYAILYAYRLNSGAGALIGYNVAVNDKVVGRAQNNSCFEVKLYQEGPTNIVAQNESAAVLTIDVKFGEEYYLNCAVTEGIVIGEPVLRIVPNWQGNIEYKKLKEYQDNKPKLIQNNSDDNSGN